MAAYGSSPQVAIRVGDHTFAGSFFFNGWEFDLQEMPLVPHLHFHSVAPLSFSGAIGISPYFCCKFDLVWLSATWLFPTRGLSINTTRSPLVA